MFSNQLRNKVNTLEMRVNRLKDEIDNDMVNLVIENELLLIEQALKDVKNYYEKDKLSEAIIKYMFSNKE